MIDEVATLPFAGTLTEWLPANDDPARPLMALSTIGVDGYPDTRHVLLSEFDDEGFFFHADSRSRKVSQVEHIPRASFAIAWPDLGRQLVVVGDVEKAPDAEIARAFANRGRYLQLLARLNTAAFAERSLDDRLRLWADFDAEHPDGTVAAPGTWTGFRIRPCRITFWNGRPDTASQRTEYTRDADGSWSSALLPG